MTKKNKEVTRIMKELQEIVSNGKGTSECIYDYSDDVKHVIESNELSEMIMEQVRTWLDEKYSSEIKNMTLEYKKIAENQEKKIRRVNKKIDEIVFYVKEQKNRTKEFNRRLKETEKYVNELIRLKGEFIELEGEVKDHRKKYKQLEKRMRVIKGCFEDFVFGFQLAAPGTSLKKIRKIMKRRIRECYKKRKKNNTNQLLLPNDDV